MSSEGAGILRVDGTRIVGNDGPVTLRGFGLGGWMNMENFITGYAGSESQQRRAAEAMVDDFARAFEGVTPDEAQALAESFAFDQCIVRDELQPCCARPVLECDHRTTPPPDHPPERLR